MGRGRGKGKRGGRGGGGRQHFISSLEELEARNVRDEAWASRRKAEREEQEDSESGDVEGGKKDVDDSESDEEDRDGASIGASAFAPRGEVNAEVVEPKKARPKGVQGLIEVDNPNAKPKSGKMMKAKDMDMSAVPVELSRREREALEAQRKKENYMKLHAEGKTQEAQVDLARLVEVRKRREEAERRRVEEEAEAEATREKMEKAAKESAAAGPQKLNPLEVKKMNPTRLKELLKERGQSLQGSKKDLISRLLQWEKDNQG